MLRGSQTRQRKHGAKAQPAQPSTEFAPNFHRTYICVFESC
jgi:hypothetical protein